MMFHLMPHISFDNECEAINFAWWVLTCEDILQPIVAKAARRRQFVPRGGRHAEPPPGRGDLPAAPVGAFAMITLLPVRFTATVAQMIATMSRQLAAIYATGCRQREEYGCAEAAGKLQRRLAAQRHKKGDPR